MTVDQVRAIFNHGLSDLTPNQAANREMLREYFTNPDFKKYMEDVSFAATLKQNEQ
jgi:hypothetical protein